MMSNSIMPEDDRPPESSQVATEQTSLLADSQRPQVDSRLSSSSLQTPQDGYKSGFTINISRTRAACIILAFTVLIFLQTANMTLMSTVQGLVAEEMNAYDRVSWFTSSYLIGQSATAPTYGRLSQIFSTRSCVLCASILFGAGALFSSQAPTLPFFLLGRAIQGIGAGGIITLSIILVVQLTPVAHRGLFIGLTNTAVTSGVSIGALIGGELGWTIGWRALMWIQTPLASLGGLCVFLSLRGLEGRKSDEATTRQKLWAFDYAGALLLVLSSVSLLIGLSAPTEGLVPFLLAAVLLILFLLNEIYRAKMPVIPISVLKSRSVLLSSLSQMLFMTSRWTVLFYSPIFVQAVFLWKPGPAGAVLIPTNAGFALGGLIVGVLHIRRQGSFYLPALVCFILFPISMLILSLVANESTHAWLFISMIFVNGFIVGSALNYCLAHVLHLSLPQHHFPATSLMATFRGFSGSFGSATGGGLFARLLQSSLKRRFEENGLTGRDDLIRRLLGQASLVGRLGGLEREIARKGYEDATRGVFLAACILGALTIVIQASAGWKGPKDDRSRAVEEDSEGGN